MIMMNNVIFEEFITPFALHELILQELGYKLINSTYAYRSALYTLEKTKRMCSDLLVLRGAL